MTNTNDTQNDAVKCMDNISVVNRTTQEEEQKNITFRWFVEMMSQLKILCMSKHIKKIHGHTSTHSLCYNRVYSLFCCWCPFLSPIWKQAARPFFFFYVCHSVPYVFEERKQETNRIFFSLSVVIPCSSPNDWISVSLNYFVWKWKKKRRIKPTPVKLIGP